MSTRTATVGSPVGLHARPASTLVAAAGRAKKDGVTVTIATDGDPVPANSILSVIALGAGPGTAVTLTAEGDAAERVLDELVAIVESEEE